MGQIFSRFFGGVFCTFSALGFLEGLLGGLWAQKRVKTHGFLRFLKRLFKAPDGPLGLILPPLWPIWSQNGPQNGSQKCSTKDPKIVHYFFVFFYVEVNISQHKSQPKPKMKHKMDQHFCTKFKRDLQEKPR